METRKIKADDLPSPDDERYVRNIKLIALLNTWTYRRSILDMSPNKDGVINSDIHVAFIIEDGKDGKSREMSVTFDYEELDFENDLGYNHPKIEELSGVLVELYEENKKSL